MDQERRGEEGGDAAEQLDQGEDALQLGGAEGEAGDEEPGRDRGADAEPDAAGAIAISSESLSPSPVRSRAVATIRANPESTRTGTQRVKKR